MDFPETLVASNAVAGLLLVTGEDAFAYLQSQFSNDLRRPDSDTPATYGLWLTRKGKVAADSLVARLGPSEFLLLSFHTPTEKLSGKVLENVIADDVETAPATWPCFTVAGRDAKAVLGSLGLPVPAAGAFARTDEAIVVASRRGAEGYEVLVTAPESPTAECIRKMVTTCDAAAALESMRVRACVPRVPDDCGESDLPQEAGLDEDAVSFAKGCYLGQEVMARLRSQGRANRVLTPLLIEKGTGSGVGAKLFAGAAEAGEVRSKANVGAACVAMAMLRLRVAEGVENFSLTPDGEPALTRLPAS